MATQAMAKWMSVAHLGREYAVFCLVLGLRPTGVAAQSPPCDSSLTRLAAPVNGYRDWGDRCEGLYTRQVSGTTLFLASLTESFEDYDLQSGDSLIVDWSKPGAADVQLRAETLKGGRYYRMDTVRPVGTTSYHWPSSILSAERIPRKELGVVGWTRVVIGGAAVDLYLPLRIRQGVQAARCGTYEVAIWPGEQLMEVYVGVAPVGVDGRLGQLVRNDSLNYGFYPAQSPIKFQLKQSDIGTPGVYYIKIGARLSQGGTSTKEYWIYLPGGSRPGCS